jgi:hypothetical protein
MIFRKTLVIAAAALLIFGICGCGDGSSPKKAIKQAEEAAESVEKRLKKLKD